MKETFKLVKSDKIIRWGMTASFILLFSYVICLALFYASLPPVVPLYNQLPWGEVRLGAKYETLLPLTIATLFFIVNYFLLSKLYRSMPLVSRIISITTLLAAVLTFIFIVRTIQLIV